MSVVVRNFLRNLLPAAALAAMLSFGATATTPLDAGIISGTPISTSTLNTPALRMRAGDPGNFEGRLFYRDANGNQNDAGVGDLNIGSWPINSPRKFQVLYSTDATSGTWSLKIDADNSNSFETAETVTFNSSQMANTGFRGFRLWHTQQASGTPIYKAKITNLNINGVGFADPDNSLDTSIAGNTTVGVSNFYKDANDAGVYNWNITGSIEFEGINAQEAPRWEIRMMGAVPEPGSLSLFALGLGGIAGFRRRRS
jgi:hypothetical protein